MADARAELPILFEGPDLESAWTAHSSAGPVQKVIDVADTVLHAHGVDPRGDLMPDGALREDDVMRYVVPQKAPSTTAKAR